MYLEILFHCVFTSFQHMKNITTERELLHMSICQSLFGAKPLSESVLDYYKICRLMPPAMFQQSCIGQMGRDRPPSTKYVFTSTYCHVCAQQSTITHWKLITLADTRGAFPIMMVELILSSFFETFSSDLNCINMNIVDLMVWHLLIGITNSRDPAARCWQRGSRSFQWKKNQVVCICHIYRHSR